MSREPTALPPSDEELACRAQQGCTASFEELVRRFQVPLVHFLRQRNSAADADDLTQETFVRAYENIHRYRPAWRFPTWLFTIARRLSLNYQRRRRPTPDSDAIQGVAGDSPEPGQAASEAEGRRLLWDAAREVLSEGQWTAVWMYYVEDMSVQEIARIEGRSAMAVKTMLFRARRRLLPLLSELRPLDAEAATRRSARSAAAEVTHG